MLELSREQLVTWAAGFFDGEGSIMLAGHTHGPARNRHEGHMKLVVAATNTDLPSLQRLVGIFGGRIDRSRARTDHHRESFVWRIYNHAALAALQEMEPFILIKLPQLRVAQEFMVGVRTASWGGPPGMPQTEIDRRVVLREAMTILNAKGPRE